VIPRYKHTIEMAERIVLTPSTAKIVPVTSAAARLQVFILKKTPIVEKGVQKAME